MTEPTKSSDTIPAAMDELHRKTLISCARLAITVQDSANASGVIHEMVEDVVPVISRHMTIRGEGTEWRNCHPILRLFYFKLMDLAHCNVDYNQFHDAYELCKKIAAGDTEAY